MTDHNSTVPRPRARGQLDTMRHASGVRLSKADTVRWRSDRDKLTAELIAAGHKPGAVVRNHRTVVLGRLGDPETRAATAAAKVAAKAAQRAAALEEQQAKAAPPPPPAPVMPPAPEQPPRRAAVELVTAAQTGRALTMGLAELVPGAASPVEALTQVARELAELRAARAAQLSPAELVQLRAMLAPPPAPPVEPAPAPEPEPEPESPPTERPAPYDHEGAIHG